MSIILLCFPNAPGVSQEAIQREVELNAYIEEKVTESFRQEEEEEQGSASLFRVMHDLAQQNLPNLPPGAGLCSKRDLIVTMYKKLKAETEAVNSRDSEESR
uniref:Protein serine/threonine phosphatase 2C C-terminal domain-containing protein n=2 Tax=Callorhinchus milii TaxID=7868 RepID=A0A4W3GSW4_CALMI